jgi:ferredoxin-NADP reductase/fatty acid desaturase
MAFAFSVSTKEILEQVIREPRFRAITTIPVFSWIPISTIAIAYMIFLTSSYYYLQGQLPIALTIAINGFSIYLAFTPLHDATHRTVSGNRVINDILGTISCFMLLPGITTRIYRYLHLEHHRFTGNKDKDPDEIYVATPALLSPFVLFFPDIVWSVWYLRHWASRPIGERLEFSLGIAVYVGWHAAWLLSPYAMEFVLLWVLPQRIGVWLVLYFFARIQHPENVTWEKAPFQTTVHIKTNKISHLLMLGQTIHFIHHLLPSVPFYRYHKAWAAGKILFEQQNIPQRSFFTPAKNIILPMAENAHWIDVSVQSVIDIAQGIKSYEFVPLLEGNTLPPYSVGSHIDVYISDKIIRQYSLCDPSTNGDSYRIAVKCDVNGRGGSLALHETVFPGKTLKISKPRNNFPLNTEAQEYVLIAGGIGITPILSMAYKLHQLGKKFSLTIAARSEKMLAFASTLASSPFADRITYFFDNESTDERFSADAVVGKWFEGKELYMCGPSGFMSSIVSAARENSWPDTFIHSETFVSRNLGQLKNLPFEVKIASSGKVFQVAADEFLIDVLNRNHCGVPCSCTQGICGSCITPVASGEIEHRDAILTDTERAAGDQMCVCVGRARGGRIVLDI